MTRVSPCGWTPSPPPASGSGCCPNYDDPAKIAVKAQAESLAASILWRLTGMQYGCCEITVRPCKPRNCDPITLSQLIYWDSRAFLTFGQPNMGVLSFFPTLIGGQVFNISGCGSCDNAAVGCQKCRADCQVQLPGPVCSIANVTVDGVTLVAGEDYLVYDNGTLAFVEDTCPTKQDYNLPNGSVGTWSATYSIGIPVPDELNFAAGLYAVEIFKSLDGDKGCSLPARVQQVTRQGVNVTYIDPVTLTNAGLTGLPLVDQIIRAINPYQLVQQPRVWTPGKTNNFKTETT